MKKLSLLIGVASLVFAGTNITAASAAGTGSSTKDVIVGNTMDPIYSVDIGWGDFQFDWKYENNTYGFAANVHCGKYTEGYPGIIAGEYYSNKSCTTAFNGDPSTGNFYLMRGIPALLVIDNSSNGRVKANVSFSPSSNYSWVTGKFYQNYSLQGTDNTITYSNQLTSGNMVQEMGEMHAYLKLESSNGASYSSSVVSGDKIGTVTLTISPDTN